MTQEQEVDFSIMGADEWNETDQKISQIKNILKEEWVENDPELLDAFDEAIKDALKND